MGRSKLFCNACGELTAKHVKRLWWMRFFPGSSLYKCQKCYQSFFHWLGLRGQVMGE